MATSSLFCSVLVLISMVAGNLERPRIRSDIPKAESLKWKENVDGYPEEAAEYHVAMLESQNKIQYFITGEKIKELSKYTTPGEQNNTENLCPSVKRRRVPKSVEINGQEFYVLNPTAKPIQYIETEECNTNVTNSFCNFVETENTYSTKCTQEFITRELYLMKKTNPYEVLQVELLQVESCCSCLVITNYQ